MAGACEDQGDLATLDLLVIVARCDILGDTKTQAGLGDPRSETSCYLFSGDAWIPKLLRTTTTRPPIAG